MIARAPLTNEVPMFRLKDSLTAYESGPFIILACRIRIFLQSLGMCRLLISPANLD